MFLNGDISWLDKTIKNVPKNKFLFNILKFFLGKWKKGITYRELYMVYTNIYNISNTIPSEIKNKAMQVIINLYTYNQLNYE